jgi:flagellar basal body-associated protein FliL
MRRSYLEQFLCQSDAKFVILDWMNDPGSDGNETDNTASLEELINRDPSAPVTVDLDAGKLDALLYSQDPKFKEKLSVLRQHEIKDVEIELDTFDLGALESLEDKRDKVSAPSKEEASPKIPIKVRLMRWARENFQLDKNVSQKLVQNIVHSIRNGLISAVHMVTRFNKLSRTGKLLLFSMLGLTVLLGLSIRLALRGELLPDFTIRLLPTVAEKADASWNYPEDEQTDDFFSSTRHPEHIVLIERLVVNVKPSENSGKNPMGYFDFYVEGSSEKTAVELNDRKSEVKDVMQRTLEGITYDELVTVAGKNKLKLVMRKNLNTILTTGRVRRIFLKSIVIKP